MINYEDRAKGCLDKTLHEEDFQISYDEKLDSFIVYGKMSDGINFVALGEDKINDTNRSFIQNLVNQYSIENAEDIVERKEYHKISSLFESYRDEATREGIICKLPEDFNPINKDWEKFMEYLEDSDTLYVYDDIEFLSGTAGFVIKDQEGVDKKHFVIWRS